jgi:hypothetical protein
VADGFLGRWSQRKQAVREGREVVEPPAPAIETVAAPAPEPESPAAPPPLTLDDARALTAESDFSPFVGRGATPEVRNAAMKKLFSDPHYNVMDQLDIYIDDYSKPDPLPPAMLRQMASAKFLNLFDEEPPEPSPPVSPPPSLSPSPPVDTPPLLENTPQAPGPDHDHTDLRLQPNDAAEPQEPGGST